MRKQPLDFRKDETQYVMQRWQASESCSLVGVGSVGKSNLLQHLSDQAVQAHYMSTRSQNFKAIIIDPNLLGPIDAESNEQFRCWAGYELLMHRLYMAFYPFDTLGDDATNFFDAYQALQDGSNPLYAYMGLRYFELGLEFFLRRDLRIVFLFDEFEEMARKMPEKFFQTLRGLRDNHKNNLSYLTFSREPLPVMFQKFHMSEMEIEPFAELFTDNVYYVGPYNRIDAKAMVERLVQRNPQISYSQAAIDFLLYASGRYAGVIRAGFRSLEWLGDIYAEDIQSSALVDRLTSRQPVRTECETIWKSLTEVEQKILTAVAKNQLDTLKMDVERAIALLVQKRLLRVDQERQQLQIEPPVFRSYIATIVLQ